MKEPEESVADKVIRLGSEIRILDVIDKQQSDLVKEIFKIYEEIKKEINGNSPLRIDFNKIQHQCILIKIAYESMGALEKEKGKLTT